MPICDPEHSARLLDEMEKRYATHAEDPGSDGALSRAFPISKAFQIWLLAEVERGTTPAVLAETVARLTATQMATCAASTATDGAAPEVLGSIAKLGFQTALLNLQHGVMGSVDVYPGRRS